MEGQTFLCNFFWEEEGNKHNIGFYRGFFEYTNIKLYQLCFLYCCCLGTYHSSTSKSQEYHIHPNLHQGPCPLSSRLLDKLIISPSWPFGPYCFVAGQEF